MGITCLYGFMAQNARSPKASLHGGPPSRGRCRRSMRAASYRTARAKDDLVPPISLASSRHFRQNPYPPHGSLARAARDNLCCRADFKRIEPQMRRAISPGGITIHCSISDPKPLPLLRLSPTPAAWGEFIRVTGGDQPGGLAQSWRAKDASLDR